MSPELASLLVAVERAAKELPPEDIPALLGDLRRIEAVAEGRMISTLAQMNGRAEAQTTGDRLLTIPEVADLLAVPTARVYEMIRRGDLPAAKVGKKNVRVPSTDLREWLAKNRLDTVKYALYSRPQSGRPYDRPRTPPPAQAARSATTRAGGAGRRDAQHRGAMGARRGGDLGARGTAHPVPGEDGAEESR